MVHEPKLRLREPLVPGTYDYSLNQPRPRRRNAEGDEEKRMRRRRERARPGTMSEKGGRKTEENGAGSPLLLASAHRSLHGA